MRCQTGSCSEHRVVPCSSSARTGHGAGGSDACGLSEVGPPTRTAMCEIRTHPSGPHADSGSRSGMTREKSYRFRRVCRGGRRGYGPSARRGVNVHGIKPPGGSLPHFGFRASYLEFPAFRAVRLLSPNLSHVQTPCSSVNMMGDRRGSAAADRYPTRAMSRVRRRTRERRVLARPSCSLWPVPVTYVVNLDLTVSTAFLPLTPL